MAARGLGFLPVEVRLDDGRCFRIAADYVDGGFRNGTVLPSGCEVVARADTSPPVAPPRPGLRLLREEWGLRF